MKKIFNMVGLWFATLLMIRFELLLQKVQNTQTVITGERLNDLIEAKLPKGAKIQRIALDGKYRLPSKAMFEKIVKWTWTDKIPYLKETFDCDNFADRFRSSVSLFFGLNNVGTIIDNKGQHAYNIVVLDDMSVLFFEPQSDAEIHLGRVPKYDGTDVVIWM